MVSVTLYTRVGCHLCDDAKALLEAVRSETPERPFTLEVVDVDTDPALAEAYGMEVPVVMVAGRKTFKYRVDPVVLRDRLARAEQP